MTLNLLKQQIMVRHAESELVVMSMVKPAISDYGFFYAEREIETQLEYIVYQEFARGLRYRVGAMQEGDLMGIQICSESLHNDDKDYKKAHDQHGELGVMDIQTHDQLFYLDRTNNLTKAVFDPEKKMLINPKRTKIKSNILSQLSNYWNLN